MSRTIHRITNDRMPNSFQMDSNLMGTPGFQLQKEHSITGQALKHTKMSACLAAAGCDNSHLLTMTNISANRSINDSTVKSNYSFNQGQIAFHHFVTLHLLYQGSLRVRIFCNNQ